MELKYFTIYLHTIRHLLIWTPVKSKGRQGRKKFLGGGTVFGQDSVRTVLNIALAEFLGTGFLVFLGCMGTVVGLGEFPPTHLQISITFGMVVATAIQLIGHISAAHLNPAVSVAAIILGKINIPMAVVYILAELSGGIAGFGLLQVITPDSILRSKSNGSCCALCVTLPHPELSAFQAVLAEALATSVLILVVCAVWDKRNERNTDSVPLRFGFTVMAIASAEGPYTGASMNPARSLGPVIWTGVWESHWMTSPDLAGANYRPLYVASQSSGEDLKIKTPNPLDRAVHPIIDLHAEFPRDGETSTCPTTSPANWKVYWVGPIVGAVLTSFMYKQVFDRTPPNVIQVAEDDNEQAIPLQSNRHSKELEAERGSNLNITQA
uniref:Aquaporin n=1 Tax=Timema bartmani TaxID=61472 RepID=A0A7R9F077_9NEOP|nr:unnamed protein product [Timema bartmani]